LNYIGLSYNLSFLLKKDGLQFYYIGDMWEIAGDNNANRGLSLCPAAAQTKLKELLSNILG